MGATVIPITQPTYVRTCMHACTSASLRMMLSHLESMDQFKRTFRIHVHTHSEDQTFTSMCACTT